MKTRDNPGSDKAIEKGCICPVVDNNYGRGYIIPGQFVIVEDCPLHGKKNVIPEINIMKESEEKAEKVLYGEKEESEEKVLPQEKELYVMEKLTSAPQTEAPPWMITIPLEKCRCGNCIKFKDNQCELIMAEKTKESLSCFNIFNKGFYTLVDWNDYDEETKSWKK